MIINIAVIKGDGIGPEIIDGAIDVLKKVEEYYGHRFLFKEVLAGGSAIDVTGEPLPKETIQVCKECDAVLLGAVGGPKWDHLSGELRPEKALLSLREELGLYANLRPAVLYESLKGASPLRDELLSNGIDICVVRELTGGIYFGEKGRNQKGKLGEAAYDVEIYSVGEVERIAKVAFEIAAKRKGKVTSIDKANVLESSRLWRSVVTNVAKQYVDIELEHMYVDNAAMQLIRDPNQFDVIVTSNMFGDILSDEASMITGSIGMLPSASLGYGSKGMYEPIHGSAPDISGKNIANPIATILSAAMMLRHSFKLEEEANSIEKAVEAVLREGYRTADITSAGMKLVGTKEMTKLIINKLGVMS
ncbi:3-isopropylmalate dehydrogenase [Alkaliphilus peptidifermentans]|uniref:3-isopropylmalate dehydrogenase n=1 Tax=Alkaliphilus peptidifermentans DSM 18978 TaxID=1120976 RepID=A0A1G5JN36_9FIRM|nr:3-isopropylmalate dehydrogenase [Alkaliphilus peptidifermentans]SCY89149.1 3-isopropylmalate dehydrogenase [Alkaliphilus peptidifermentans DSM 18978]